MTLRSSMRRMVGRGYSTGRRKLVAWALTVVRSKVDSGVLRSMRICCDLRRLMMKTVANRARVFSWRRQWEQEGDDAKVEVGGSGDSFLQQQGRIE